MWKLPMQKLPVYLCPNEVPQEFGKLFGKLLGKDIFLHSHVCEYRPRMCILEKVNSPRKTSRRIFFQYSGPKL